jgi:hypothetical protein
MITAAGAKVQSFSHLHCHSVAYILRLTLSIHQAGIKLLVVTGALTYCHPMLFQPGW